MGLGATSSWLLNKNYKRQIHDMKNIPKYMYTFIYKKNLLAFATTNNLRSLFLDENCAWFLEEARGYLGRGKASQSSIPRKVMSGGSRFARALPRNLKNRFQRSWAGSLLFWVSPYDTAAYDIVGSRLWKKIIETPGIAIHSCSIASYILLSFPLSYSAAQYSFRILWFLCVMLSAWEGARLLSWPPSPG